MDTVFIYALKCPVTGGIRYIGKSKTPKRRFQNHLTEKTRCHRTNWINFLRSRGQLPILEILDEVAVEHWPQWEVAYIEFFREQGFDLVNGTPGGEDPPKHSNLGKKFSADHRAKISAARLGKKLSPETCAKMSASRLGRKLSPEVCAKRRAFMLEHNPIRGKTHTLEARAKMSAFHLGKTRQFTPEHCANIALSKRGNAPWNKGTKPSDPFSGLHGREYLETNLLFPYVSRYHPECVSA